MWNVRTGLIQPLFNSKNETTDNTGEVREAGESLGLGWGRAQHNKSWYNGEGRGQGWGWRGWRPLVSSSSGTHPPLSSTIGLLSQHCPPISVPAVSYQVCPGHCPDWWRQPSIVHRPGPARPPHHQQQHRERHGRPGGWCVADCYLSTESKVVLTAECLQSAANKRGEHTVRGTARSPGQ